MKKQARKLMVFVIGGITLILGVISLFLFMSEPNDCLKSDIQAELDSNPKLRQRSVEVEVALVKSGYVTLRVENGFPITTQEAIADGKNLRDIQRFTDSSVDVLIEIEEIIKRNPEVKSVAWTAARQGETHVAGNPPNSCEPYHLVRSVILVITILCFIGTIVAVIHYMQINSGSNANT